MTIEPPPELRDAFGLWQHEGRHPLTTIHGYAQLLEREHLGSLTEQQRQAIDNILTHTQRALEVWHRMSAYWHARYTAQAPEPVVVSALLDEIKRWLQPYPVVLALRAPDQLPSVSGQQQQLVTALCYLLFPPDHPQDCTNSALQITMQVQEDRWLETHLTSALQLPIEEQGTADWLWYPGSCCNTAAIILQQHGSSITTSRTTEGMIFAFKLPIIPS